MLRFNARKPEGLYRRIVGGEKEYGSRIYSTGYLLNSANSSEWLLNGARFYIDAGGHPEYSTPECLDPAQVALYSLAGDLEVLQRAQARHKDRPRQHIACNNLAIGDDKTLQLISWASHDNYLTKLHHDHPITEVVWRLATLQVALTPLAGNGCFMPYDNWRDYRLLLSERAALTKKVHSTNSQATKALFLIRPESLTDLAGHFRLQIAGNDSNLLFEPDWLRRAIMSLGLLMDEHSIHNLPRFRNESQALAALRAINYSEGRPVPFEIGDRKMTCYDIQWEYYKLAISFIRQYGLSDFHPAMQAWSEILTSLEDYDLDSLEGRLGWVTRWLLAQRHESRLGRRMTGFEAFNYGITTMTLFNSGIKYQRLDQSGNINYISPVMALRRRYLKPELLAEAEQQRTIPPSDTRARLRSRLLQRTRDRGWTCHTDNDWQTYRITDPWGSHVFRLGNPYETHNRKLEAWLLATDDLAA